MTERPRTRWLICGPLAFQPSKTYEEFLERMAKLPQDAPEVQSAIRRAKRMLETARQSENSAGPADPLG
jgi:hypothetical protein